MDGWWTDDGRMDGRMDGWWTDGWMDHGWMDHQMQFMSQNKELAAAQPQSWGTEVPLFNTPACVLRPVYKHNPKCWGVRNTLESSHCSLWISDPQHGEKDLHSSSHFLLDSVAFFAWIHIFKEFKYLMNTLLVEACGSLKLHISQEEAFHGKF